MDSRSSLASNLAKSTSRSSKEQQLQQLLSHGALGELEAGEEIWGKLPDLLTCRSRIYHPNRIHVKGQAPIDIPFDKNPGCNKYVNRTYYQILLMNSEFPEAKRAGVSLTLEEKRKQFDEVFPDGKIKKYHFDLEHAKKLLQSVFAAVATDECLEIMFDEYNHIKKIKNIIMSESTRVALDQLYHYAKPKSEHKIGLVFDPQFRYEALKLYDKQFTSFYKKGNFKQQSDRNIFWCVCVEEWLAGCLGTGYLRQHAQGIENSLSRSGCVLANGTSYFAFLRNPDSIPGYHFCVGGDGQAYTSQRGVARRMRGWGTHSIREYWKPYLKQKREQGESLYNHLHNQKSSCRIF